MILSPVDIIGSLCHRTTVALNENKSYMDGVRSFYFDILTDGKIDIFHIPGVPNEISGVLLKLTAENRSFGIKYPSLFNVQSIRERVSNNSKELTFNLAIVCPTHITWTTKDRDIEVFRRVLRPIYNELMNQIMRCTNIFNLGFGLPDHTRYDVFTTGGVSAASRIYGENSQMILERYGDYVDAIEIQSLKLTLKNNICDQYIEQIEKENKLATRSLT